MGAFATFAILLLVATSAMAQPIDGIRKSLVRITTTSQEPNYREPWSPGRIQRGRGAGFIIAGNRIVTNAHVVSNARFIAVEKEDDPRRYVAAVEFVAHDCDLALVKVLDQRFFNGTSPLSLGGIPELETTVSVYGYPIGGDRMSVTRGVVSRIDFETYSHPEVDSHLVIQIDAAINPGNSGGPVLQDGKVVGVAFQGYSGAVAQNVGYMIPTPVVRRFLKDIEDGHYDRYMDLLITTFALRNASQRRALGLPDDDRGVLVGSVISGGCCEGKLRSGDVLLSIDGHPIASDGFVELDGERVEMMEVVERKFKGDTVALKFLRDRKPQEVTVSLAPTWVHGMLAHNYDMAPRYLLFGGLLFQPLSRDLLEAGQIDDMRVRHYFDFFISEELFKKHPEVIVLSSLLPDPINTYLGEFRNGILDEVNGSKVRTLREAADALAKPSEQYVLKFEGKGRPLVLEREAVQSATERIKARYNVKQDQYLGLDGK